MIRVRVWLIERNKNVTEPSNGTELKGAKLDESNQLSSNICCWLCDECM